MSLPPIPRRFLNVRGHRYVLLWCYCTEVDTAPRWRRLGGTFRTLEVVVRRADRGRPYPHVVLDVQAGMVVHRNADAEGAALEPAP